MQWALDQELESPDGAKLKFTNALLASYKEPTELAAFAAGDLGGKTAERVRFVRSILQ